MIYNGNTFLPMDYARLYIDRLAHIGWIDGCMKDVSSGSPTFCYTLFERISSCLLDIRCN